MRCIWSASLVSAAHLKPLFCGCSRSRARGKMNQNCICTARLHPIVKQPNVGSWFCAKTMLYRIVFLHRPWSNAPRGPKNAFLHKRTYRFLIKEKPQLPRLLPTEKQ